MLRAKKCVVQAVNYRDFTAFNEKGEPHSTIAPIISYLLGVLSERKGTVVLVSGDDTHCFAIKQIVEKGGEGAVLFFREHIGRLLQKKVVPTFELDYQEGLGVTLSDSTKGKDWLVLI
jgi:hypothetical protein